MIALTMFKDVRDNAKEREKVEECQECDIINQRCLCFSRPRGDFDVVAWSRTDDDDPAVLCG